MVSHFIQTVLQSMLLHANKTLNDCIQFFIKRFKDCQPIIHIYMLFNKIMILEIKGATVGLNDLFK